MSATATSHKKSSLGPIRWAAICEFNSAVEFDGWPVRHKIRYDARLGTIHPVIAGMLCGIESHATTTNWHGLGQSVAGRSLNTRNMPWEPSVYLASVLCDWLIRTSIPASLGTLGDAYLTEAVAPQLRSLLPMLWPVHVADAIGVLSQAYRVLPRLTEGDPNHASRNVVRGYVQSALRASAGLLEVQLGSRESEALYWIGVRVIDGTPWFPCPDLLPILDVMLSIRPGETQETIAARCIWGTR